MEINLVENGIFPFSIFNSGNRSRFINSPKRGNEEFLFLKRNSSLIFEKYSERTRFFFEFHGEKSCR